eukprot:3536820-Rhodomonas_salina.1
MDKEDAFRYFHSFNVCCKSIDGGKIPKHEGKSEEVKQKRDEPPAHNMSFEFNPIQFSGAMGLGSRPVTEEGFNIDIGMERLMADPEKWAALQYHQSFLNAPKDQQQWVLWARSSNIKPQGVGQGEVVLVEAKFKALGPASFTDDVCETQEMSTYGGYPLGWRRPGRGEG